MRIAGIIAEYNPFHRGHAWQIARTREAGCDRVIVCMGGHFTQRGEAAILSKWDRARMALACGADAVFELPALFAVRTADAFARGGVGILAGLGVDVLSFGSEITDMPLLRALASLRDREPEAVSAAISQKLDAGMAHARAWGEAVGAYLGVAPELLNRPNAVLAAEYIRALERLAPAVTPLAIPRQGDYHDAAMGAFASATAIRAAFARGVVSQALEAIPEPARPWASPEALHPMDDMLLYRLRQMTPEALAALPDMGEGLEHRLYRLCRSASGREALLDGLKCKRYTRARLSRILTYALLGLDRAALEAAPQPGYARLIGLRRGSEGLLGALKVRAGLPIVSGGDLRGDPCFEWECRATDTWSLMHDDPRLRIAGREYTEKFVVV
ncbi:MAG: nucleotidyltransferase family protein [Clostridia bacterium]|nr:nucleotidyltransferase family protein [Clostridia bacterium]